MSWMDRYKNVDVLVGKTLVSVTKNTRELDDDEIIFITDDGTKYRMHHEQNCCESVSIEDIEGDLADLVGTPITLAEESTSEGDSKSHGGRVDESSTWTFYRFATNKGFVTIRWYGSSNGYYSESVNFVEIAK